MPGLRELQIGFAEGLSRSRDNTPYNPQNDGDFAAGHIVANGIGGARRLQIYRNNSNQGLRGALQSLYPAVEKMVGESFFAHCADHYVRQHPSRHGDVRRYGSRFPEFLGEFPPCQELSYLPELARLEWCYHEVFHAPDCEPVGLASIQQSLAQVDPEDHTKLRFDLNPAARLLQSRFPLSALWEMHKQEDPDELNLDSGGEQLLIIRRSGIEFVHLGPERFAFLEALAAKQTLAEAVEQALAVNSDFNLARHLVEMINNRILVGIHTPS